MIPAQKNKIDLTLLSPEEQKLFRLYGRLPAQKTVLSHRLRERKYFDSGDYALTKAGKAQGPVGSQHPSPETVPHANAMSAQSHSSSPVKESHLVHEATEDGNKMAEDGKVKEGNDAEEDNQMAEDNTMAEDNKQ